MRDDGRTDRHDEDNSRFAKCFESALKRLNETSNKKDTTKAYQTSIFDDIPASTKLCDGKVPCA